MGETMTNNPTIDGVSRDLLANLHKIASRKCKSAWSAGVCDELRALLDAPTVERQEPVTMKRQYLTVPGLWIECADDDPQAMTFYKQAPEVSALQSTIARLEARIAELESGRGEPVAWANGEQLKLCTASPREVQPNNPMMHNLPRNIAGSALKTDYCNTPLFTAPPAPVAVDERAEFEEWVKSQWHQAPIKPLIERIDPRYGDYSNENIQRCWVGWQARACLDATAALNGPAK